MKKDKEKLHILHLNLIPTFLTPTEKVWVKLIHIIDYIVTLGTPVAVLQTLPDTLEAAGGEQRFEFNIESAGVFFYPRHFFLLRNISNNYVKTSVTDVLTYRAQSKSDLFMMIFLYTFQNVHN